MSLHQVEQSGATVGFEAPIADSLKERVAILGCGILGTMMARGLQEYRGGRAYRVTATQRTAERAEAISRDTGIFCLSDNRKACREADIVILAVRPQAMPDLLKQVRSSIKPGAPCITIAAGLPISFYEELLLPNVTVVRALPSPLMALGRGLTAFSANELADERQVEKARRILALLCEEAMLIPERDLDLFGALFGSSAALLYLFVDAALSAERCKDGPGFSSRRVIAGMLNGASHMLVESSKSPRELCRQICTPNGMTAAGVKVWEQNDVSRTLTSAMEAILSRAAEMGRGE